MSALGDSFRRIGHFDVHHRFLVALGAAGAAFLLTMACGVKLPYEVLTAWNVFTLTALALGWITIVHADPEKAARDAPVDDPGRTALSAIVLLSCCGSLVTAAALLGSAKGLQSLALALHVGFTLLTVASSWLLVHTVLTLRYAHTYYGLDDEKEAQGGLKFPEEEQPEYLDFAYYSFCIGMTFQTSDVDITSRSMRLLTTLHALLSFGFNTVIVAETVNLAGSLFSK